MQHPLIDKAQLRPNQAGLPTQKPGPATTPRVRPLPRCVFPMALARSAHPVCKRCRLASEFSKNRRKQEMIQAAEEGRTRAAVEDARGSAAGKRGNASQAEENAAGIPSSGLKRTFLNHFPPAPFSRGQSSGSRVKARRKSPQKGAAWLPVPARGSPVPPPSGDPPASPVPSNHPINKPRRGKRGLQGPFGCEGGNRCHVRSGLALLSPQNLEFKVLN